MNVSILTKIKSFIPFNSRNMRLILFVFHLSLSWYINYNH